MPEPDNSFRKIVYHFIDELAWPHLGALGLVSFFFFFAATNGLLKLTGRDISSFDFPVGPVIGISSALAVIVLCAAIKLRPKS
ncbi:MAG: hypothetical protein CMI16_14960 [Opitutaceae bacterium]|nr:hypothetical protein [Opitutaceae bacterium]|tara:strand:- start:342 stop:590 length:249 start_codon:yes stop_codon:yes gene_type:complete